MSGHPSLDAPPSPLPLSREGERESRNRKVGLLVRVTGTRSITDSSPLSPSRERAGGEGRCERQHYGMLHSVYAATAAPASALP